jgi:hypothetical protein
MYLWPQAKRAALPWLHELPNVPAGDIYPYIHTIFLQFIQIHAHMHHHSGICNEHLSEIQTDTFNAHIHTRYIDTYRYMHIHAYIGHWWYQYTQSRHMQDKSNPYTYLDIYVSICMYMLHICSICMYLFVCMCMYVFVCSFTLHLASEGYKAAPGASRRRGLWILRHWWWTDATMASAMGGIQVQ